MPDFIAQFITELTWTKVLIGLGIFLGTILVSVLVVGFILVRLPATYFLDSHCRDLWVDRHPYLRWLGKVLKNLVGVLLVLAGIVQLVGPGQGILTMLIGIMLLDFPGKARLERKILRRPGVLKTINGLRARYGRPPLILDEAPVCPDPSTEHSA
jgi:hypothetical protein